MAAIRSTYPPQVKAYRVFSFDCGTVNMGMCSILIPLIGEARIEKVDWRSLMLGSKPSPVDIVCAIGSYLTSLTGRGGELAPDKALIEQQVVSSAYGSNYEAFKIEMVIIAIIHERYPNCEISVVSASARKHGGSKQRASVLGNLAILLYGGDLYSLVQQFSDPQHVCDAVTMVADEEDFKGMDRLKEEMRLWSLRPEVVLQMTIDAEEKKTKREAAKAAKVAKAEKAETEKKEKRVIRKPRK